MVWCSMPPFDDAYLNALCERRATATPVPPRQVHFRNGETPRCRNCHSNVDTWVAENPKCKPVRGWLVISDGLLNAHSVVADTDGVLFDITPQPVSGLRFFRHPGTESEFRALIERYHEVHCVLYL
jgi:hypothetical protein